MEKVWDKVVKIDNVAPSSDAKDEALSLVITENSNHDEIVPVEHTSSPTATSGEYIVNLYLKLMYSTYLYYNTKAAECAKAINCFFMAYNIVLTQHYHIQ